MICVSVLMILKREMHVLSEMSSGEEDVLVIAGALNMSRTQIYRVVKSLREKDLVKLNERRLTLCRGTYQALLSTVLHYSFGARDILADSGLEVLAEMTEPKTVSEIATATEVHQTTVSRKITDMRRVGMIRKTGTRYYINHEHWPNLKELAEAYKAYKMTNDLRVPTGSILYYSSKAYAIFSNDKELEYTKTAFSLYSEMGVTLHHFTNYYCTLESPLTVQDVFTHSLHIISVDDDWRLKMMALIFHVKYRDELGEVKHPMKDLMNEILKGSRVKGWVPLWEMQERADMYGVKLE
jgi:Transcriptional regulator